jgi:N-methylhydantoinase A
MERALRVVSVERGHDPRLFTLVAFGGAGPLHACDLAASLRMPRVLVPANAGVLSALGIARAPVSRDFSAAAFMAVRPDGRGWSRVQAKLSAMAARLERRGVRELRADGQSAGVLTARRFLEMRYAGQSYELSVPADELSPAAFLPRFHALHHERYSHSEPERTLEVVGLRVRLTASGEAEPQPRFRAERGAPLIGRRRVWFDGRATAAAVYERSRLAGGATIVGPAIVVQMDATTAVPPRWRGRVDRWGNLVLERPRG